jgi:hypothetical protein
MAVTEQEVIGRFSWIADPHGAVVALIQPPEGR